MAFPAAMGTSALLSRRLTHDHEATLRDYFFGVDRKTSDATVIAQPAASPSSIPWGADTAVMPVPNKDNDWLGFCPSAVRLQNGERKAALKKRTDYGASFAAAGLTTYYCSTKGCLFRGFGSVDLAWRTVMKDESLGIKCKWPFLAKSHVKQSQVSGRAFGFQCPICIFTHGHAEGRIWSGVEMYMEHVSTHRGKELSPDLLHKLSIVNDRIVEDKEDFDLNIAPLQPPQQWQAPRSPSRDSMSVAPNSSVNGNPPSMHRTTTRSTIAESIWSRKTSAFPDLSRSSTIDTLTRSERADSVLSPIWDETPPSQEPWSLGLSEFKMDREEDYFSPDF